VKSRRRILTEDKGIGVPQQQIWEFFATAIAARDGVAAYFLSNMDERWHQDWADRAEQDGLVPRAHESDHLLLPMSRAGKRITLMACIAANGHAILP
jgi:hypothetical protein